MVHVGVDLHKRVVQIAVLKDDGEITEHRLSTEPAGLERLLAGIEAPARVAVEATGTWSWFVDIVQRTGHEAVLSNPKQTKAIAAARLKNDRVDAERLALLLRGHLLPTVWIAPPEVLEARELIRHRVGLVQVRTQLSNRLRALLARRNLLPTTTTSWRTRRGEEELEQVALPTIPAGIRADCVALAHELDARIGRLDQELNRQWGQDPRVRRLTTIPGVGIFTAIALVVELGEIRRFPSAKLVASYLGLTPRVRASAGHVRMGHITKEGNRLLRWLLVIAALHAVRRPGPLRTWSRALQKRKGTKLARVAVARRLAGEDPVPRLARRDGLLGADSSRRVRG